MGVIRLFDEYQSHKNQFLEITSKNDLPINIVKDYLHFFNISIDDISSLIQFSEEQEKQKEFVLLNKKNFALLTEKEIEIFKMVVNGKKTVEIAATLFIEPCTVSTHRKHIKSKLNLKSIFDWYQYANAFKLLNFSYV
ncbi:LuxR C-terminal-related transcriptional regulator [Polaribacter sp. PL03]|uniref:LuxR C-terminal-related transcriptional regulator n=1 Tax=Polaribacter sp. PL03 TaxID=3088353 RepID=UPI0029D30CF1|nr:LuxR C-terminal-related transcriptional regulator [Polaribacter sp. PL03]MDX6746090.1 LuxR C-terminal-related transcriptional regulator [Polaribacter sp. PL03]